MHRKLFQQLFVFVLILSLTITLGMRFQTLHNISADDSSDLTYTLKNNALIDDHTKHLLSQLESPRISIHSSKTEQPQSIVPIIENEQKKELPVKDDTVYTYEVTAYYLNVRANPNADSNILKVVKQGTILDIHKLTENGWLELKNGGYVNGHYAKLVTGEEVNNTAKASTDIPTTVKERIATAPQQDVTKNGVTEPGEPTSTVKSDSGLTEAHIAKIFEGTALAGHELEDAILEIEEEYGINAYFTIAVMKLESGNGKSRLAKNKNNLFGLNAIDGNKENKAFSFKTKGDSVRKFGQLLSKNYVGKGYTTIDKVAKKYCPANPKWSSLVKKIMQGDYRKL